MASEYSDWIESYDKLDESDRYSSIEEIKRFPILPLFSVIIPTYETPEALLREAVESVLGQYYPFFELCIVDDCSTSPTVRRVINEYKARDNRVRAVFRSQNGHISRASNDALAIANGDYVALLDHDDVMRPNALFMVAKSINANPNVDIIYSDEDKIDLFGNRHSPYFKSEWNEQLLMAQNYACHLIVYRTHLLREIGGFRSEFDGSQDYDLILRASRAAGPSRIAHVPHILYHWRATPSSTANNSDAAKPYARNAASAAVLDAIQKIADVQDVRQSQHPAFHDLTFRKPLLEPRVSLIVSCDGQTSCNDVVHWLEGFKDILADRSIEVVLVAGKALSQMISAMPAAEPVRLIVVGVTSRLNAGRFGFFNAGAAEAKGDVLCFLSSTARPGSPHWLVDLIGHLGLPDVGVVGPCVTDKEGTVTGGSYFLSEDGIATPQYRTLKPGHLGDFGYFGRAVVAQDVSALAETGLVIRAADFRRMSGFDPVRFPRFAAVDLCLRMTESRSRIVWIPRSRLIETSAFAGLADLAAACESTAAESSAERHRFQKKWAARLVCDPVGNPNLRISGGRPALAFPPVGRAARHMADIARG
jgi:O-antigen biosynthesis protein